jgi:hypothetical protein
MLEKLKKKRQKKGLEDFSNSKLSKDEINEQFSQKPLQDI